MTENEMDFEAAKQKLIECINKEGVYPTGSVGIVKLSNDKYDWDCQPHDGWDARFGANPNFTHVLHTINLDEDEAVAIIREWVEDEEAFW